MALSAGSVEIRLFAELARLQSDMKKANKVVEDAMGGITKTVRATTTIFNNLAGAFGAAQLVKMADEYKRFDAQLKLSTKSLEEYNEAYANTIRIGRTAQSDIGAIGVLYARLNNNLRDFNVTQREVSDVTETISLALRVNNATVQETNSTMLQLSQSFGSGRLNGQEFLAVAEGAPALLRQLAKSLGVPFGALKDLSAQGKITRDVLLQAWSDPEYLAALRAQVKEVGTVTSAVTVFNNNLKQFIGEADKATGVTRLLADTITLLADNLNALAAGALALIIVQGTKYLASIYASVVAFRARQVEMIKEEILLERKIIKENAAALAMANNARAQTLYATRNSAAILEQAAVQRTLAERMTATSIAGRTMTNVFNALGGGIGVATLALTGLYFWLEKVFNDRKIQQYGNAIDGIRERAKQLQAQVKAGISVDDPYANEKLSIKELEKARDALFNKMQNQQKLLQSGSIFAPDEATLKQTAIEYVQATKDIDKAQKDLQFNIDLQNDKLKTSVEVQKENVKTTKELTEAEKSYRRVLENRKSADQEIEDLQKVTVLLKQGLDVEEARFRVAALRDGLLPAQIEALLREKEIQAEIAIEEEARRDRLQEWIKQQTQAQEDARKAAEDAVKAEKKRIEDIEDARVKAAKEANDEIERANDRLYNNLARSITDSIVRGFENGKSVIETFKDTIRNAFKSFVVNVGVNFVQQGLKTLFGNVTKSILGAAGSLFSGGALAGDSVATAGLLDQAKNVFNVVTKGFDGDNAALQGSIESFGAFLANGQGGIFDAIGGFIGQYSSVISNIAPFAGAALSLLQGDTEGALFQGGGAALGSILGGPVGGVIGATLGGLFGGFGGKKQPPRTVTPLPQVSEQFNAQLSALLGGFGLANEVSSNVSYNGRAGGSGYGTLQTNVNGMANTLHTKDKDAYSQASLDAFVQRVLTVELVNAIKRSDIGAGFISLFDGLADQTQIANMIQATIGLNNANAELIDRFGLTADSAATLAKYSGLAGDELINLVTSLAQAAGAFKTPAQQLIAFRDTLTKDLGRALPATLDAFDGILKSFDTTTTAGKDLFLAMFNLRDEFSQFTSSLDGIKKGVSDSIFTLLSPQAQDAMNRARLAEEFAKFNLEVPKTTQQLIAIGQGIDYTTEAGLTLALAFPTLVEAFQAVNAEVLRLNSALNPDRFRTFTDFVIANSYARQGLALPAANMPSYDVGTSYVPNDGVAMLHQGEAVLTRTENNAISMNSDRMVSLLERLVVKIGGLEYDMKRVVDGTQRTARELEDITGGDVTLLTQVA